MLSVRNLEKWFGNVHAVRDVSLDIHEREIIGVIGDNGAGKSTFLSLLTGYFRPDSGTFLYRGKPIAITSPKTSRDRLRIEMIYQNLRLAPDLTVWENLFLGEEIVLGGVIANRRRMRAESAKVLERLNSKVKPGDIVANLSGGEQQVVAIGRALLFDRDVVLMDEPTAAISVNKVEEVLRLVQQLKEYGKTVLLVSHRLEDIIAVCDRIAVFYQGRIREVLPNERGLQLADLVHKMFAADVNGAMQRYGVGEEQS